MTEQIFGIYELDGAGTILYSRQYGAEQALPGDAMAGRNFFEPITGESGESLLRRFRSFVKSGHSVESFIFSHIGEKELTAKVLMTRGHEKQDDISAGIFILDIRQAV